MEQFGKTVGRILLSAIFIVSGVMKIIGWPAALLMMREHDLPAPAFLLAVTILIEIVCGVLLFTGLGARAGALVLFLYLIPVTSVMHRGQQVQILKNVAIMGGLVCVAADRGRAKRQEQGMDKRDGTME
jgi:putative oxidoreductase